MDTLNSLIFFFFFLFFGISKTFALPTNNLIVHLDTAPRTQGGDSETIKAVQQAFYECLRSKKILFIVKDELSTVTVSVTLQVDPQHREQIKACPQTKKIVDDVELRRGNEIEGTSEADNIRSMSEFAHKMTGVDKLKQLGFDGRGIKGTPVNVLIIVGIIDSGIDITHPAFGGCTKVGKTGVSEPSSCIIKYAHSFVPGEEEQPISDSSGHGTHVAGIIAGNDPDNEVVGVATGVELGVYKIFGADGTTSTSAIIKAINQAYKDGMDVINMSLGTPSGSAESEESLVVDELSRMGVVFTVAIGNDGQEGLWYASHPAIANRASAISSFDTAIGQRGSFKVEGFNQTSQILMATRESMDGGDWQGPYDLVTVSEEGATNKCKRLETMDLMKKGLLVRSDECDSLIEISSRAYESGAEFLILFSPTPGEIGELVDPNLAVFTIGHSSGMSLASFIQKSPTKSASITFNQGKQEYVLGLGGAVSVFSSWGVGPNYDLRPDFGAPGANMYSAYSNPSNPSVKYKSLSGTSMASPYVAGCYALFLQHLRQSQGVRKYGIEVDTIKELILNYAAATDNQEDPNELNYQPVIRQGSGLIQIDRAIFGKSRVTPGRLPLGKVEVGANNRPVDTEVRFTIRNSDTVDKEYLLSSRIAPTINMANPMDPKELKSHGTAQFWNETLIMFAPTLKVTVPSNSQVQVRAKILPDREASPDGFFYLSGYIQVEPFSKTAAGIKPGEHDYVMSIPYGGVIGKTPSAINPDDIKLKFKAKKEDENFAEEGASITMSDAFTIKSSRVLVEIQNKVPVSVTAELLDENKTVLGIIGTKCAHLSRYSATGGLQFGTPRFTGLYTPQGAEESVPITKPGIYYIRLSYKHIPALNEANLPMPTTEIPKLFQMTIGQVIQATTD